MEKLDPAIDNSGIYDPKKIETVSSVSDGTDKRKVELEAVISAKRCARFCSRNRK